MIKITKRKEPKEWTEYRNTPGVDYQSIPELVDSLLQEQDYICAYCMRRIPCKDKLNMTESTNEDHRIEHILSREKHSDQNFLMITWSFAVLVTLVMSHTVIV